MKPTVAGALLLIAALVVLLSGHVLLHPPTVGVPQPMDIAGPPQVGDCVLSAPDPSYDPGVGALPVVFGSCRGVVAGEIVSVSPGRPAPSDGAIGVLMGTAGPCWEAASRYAGLRTSDGVAALPIPVTTPAVRDTPQWLPTLRVRGQLVSADRLQEAAGRPWSACMVRPDDLTVYLGSVRGALVNGSAPAPYGDCAPAGNVSMSYSAPCSRPHSQERLGWATVPNGSQSQAALDLSCRDLAVRLLRKADPTYAGLLEIVASRGDVTTCSLTVRGSARLQSSLIGIAGGPLPLTT